MLDFIETRYIMAIRIITDSSCDLPFSKQEDWGIDIMPFHVFFGDDEYTDGRNLTRQKFYELMADTDELPKTAQITPVEFIEIFKPYIEKGDEIIVLPISKHMSGTYNCALLAKEEFPDAPIYIVDTLNVTFALALLVDHAVRLRDKGLGAADIVKSIDQLKNRLRLYAVISDLKYLKLGGRLSSVGAAVGSILNIKPIICIRDGKVIGADKARGLNAGYQSVLSHAKDDRIDTDFPVYFGHSDFPDALAELKKLAAGRLIMRETQTCDIGPIVGTHAGPGAVGIAFIAK